MNTIMHQTHDWLAMARAANWSVRQIARQCNVSVRTIERHFLKTVGQQPKAWLAEQRQKQAIEILRDGSSIKETASILGYKHAHHFSREFKEHWGFCPSTAWALKPAAHPHCRNSV